MKRSEVTIVTLFVLAMLGMGAFVFRYYNNLAGAWAAWQAPKSPAGSVAPSSTAPVPGQPVSPAAPASDLPLTVPSGFSLRFVAKNIPGARVLAFVDSETLLVSQTSAGKVVVLKIKDGQESSRSEITKKIKRPHGVAIDPDDAGIVYIAGEDGIYRGSISSVDSFEKIISLPTGGRHYTRTIAFGPDKKLYVSIGSSCDTCIEEDPRRAAVYVLNKDGSDAKQFAKGLRNSVFFAWNPATGDLVGSDMGRDFLGDNLPPDEVNIIKSGANYGWPICYGKNIHDTEFDKNTYIRNPCLAPFETPSWIDLPAHSAPLGVAFVPTNSNWPEQYQGNLLVAYHGSWNSTTPTGYKIVRVAFDDEGEPGEVQDFISGWLQPDKTLLGRPVDLKFAPDGSLYVSDDKTGVLYRVTFGPEQAADELKVTEPPADSIIASPVLIKGVAPGPWFFEANFPIEVTSASGEALGGGFATAQTDWMTTANVPFIATINFKKSPTNSGFIIFKNDNPSGLPEKAKEFKFPIKFK